MLQMQLAPNPTSTDVLISIEYFGTGAVSTGNKSRSDEKAAQGEPSLAAQAPVGHLTVVDVSGKLMWEKQRCNLTSTQQLSVADFPAGVYFVTLRADGAVVTKRLVVSKL
jgi:hypothetical protein